MALRTYIDRDGAEWRVWCVVPDAVSSASLGEYYRHGWLCFERVDGSDRRRLAMTQAPMNWEALSAERLDVLRLVAEPATRRASAAHSAEGDTGQLETAPRDPRTTGPRRALGEDEARG